MVLCSPWILGQQPEKWVFGKFVSEKMHHWFLFYLDNIDVDDANEGCGPDWSHQRPGVHPGVPQVHHQIVVTFLGEQHSLLICLDLKFVLTIIELPSGVMSVTFMVIDTNSWKERYCKWSINHSFLSILSNLIYLLVFFCGPSRQGVPKTLQCFTWPVTLSPNHHYWWGILFNVMMTVFRYSRYNAFHCEIGCLPSDDGSKRVTNCGNLLLGKKKQIMPRTFIPWFLRAMLFSKLLSNLDCSVHIKVSVICKLWEL